MIGYKVFYKGLINRYGQRVSVNKKNVLNKSVKWNNCGFHFCSRPEDTLRYIDGFNDEFEMTLIESGENLILHEDEYYGYYDMYVTDEYKVLRIISREEMIHEIVSSNNVFRVIRLIRSMKLSEEEIDFILSIYPETEKDISYYQKGNKKAFELKIKKTD